MTVDRARRLYGPTLVVGLLGGLGMTVGGSRPWASATAAPPGLPTIHVSVSGTDLAPLVAALGVVVLAGCGAVVATRGAVRRAVGMLVMGASIGAAVTVWRAGGAQADLASALAAKGWPGGSFSTGVEPWRWLVLASALAGTVAGAATAWLGSRWPVMGSRYDAPRAARPTAPRSGPATGTADAWRAIDEGRDPTQDQ